MPTAKTFFAVHLLPRMLEEVGDEGDAQRDCESRNQEEGGEYRIATRTDFFTLHLDWMGVVAGNLHQLHTLGVTS